MNKSSDQNTSKIKLSKHIRPLITVLVSLFLLYRIYEVVLVEQKFTPDIWVRFAISGLILGGMYALIAIGYTLVYGIMFMINFAHGEVMMMGAFGGYFVFELFNFIPAATVEDPKLTFLNAHPYISVITAFAVGVFISGLAGYFLEKIAYRPLRKAPRLILLITAIGASTFLQNVAMQIGRAHV